MYRKIIAVAFVAAALSAGTGPSAHAEDGNIERDQYLAMIMDCGGSNTRGTFFGKPDASSYLAGSEVGFHLPGLGYFYPPNLTPDPATGLGAWSTREIVGAVRKGVRPDKRMLVPMIPSHAYAALTDEDALALSDFLKSLPAAERPEEPPATGEGMPAPAPYLRVVMP